jgi:hypothetical protein
MQSIVQGLGNGLHLNTIYASGVRLISQHNLFSKYTDDISSHETDPDLRFLGSGTEKLLKPSVSEHNSGQQ